MADNQRTLGLVGTSAAMDGLRARIRLVGTSREPVLVTGPTGSGKELAARAVHEMSSRSGAFVAVNCAAIPRDLLESEFFGHERGAFTSATNSRDGHVLQAKGGTLFLDEIGEMPPELQAKLLRVLDDGMVRRIGGSRSIRVDVRIVAATNRDLSAEVRAGRFREDLFYRLAILTVAVPALRDHAEDIPMLLDHYAAQTGIPVATTAGAADMLRAYDWPGNVRELRALVVRAGIFAPGQVLDPAMIRDLLDLTHIPAPEICSSGRNGSNAIDLPALIGDIEWRLIDAALQSTDQVVAAAARALGVKRSTLVDKIGRRQSVLKSLRAAYRARLPTTHRPRHRSGRGLRRTPVHRRTAWPS